MATLNNILKQNKGFTLIELLVVISIIGFILTAGLYNFNLARVKAKDVIKKNDLSQIYSALESYYGDNGYYPGMKNGLPDCTLSNFWDYCDADVATLFSDLSSRKDWPSAFKNELASYINLPLDPDAKTSGAYMYKWDIDDTGVKCDSKVVLYAYLGSETTDIHPCTEDFPLPNNNWYIIILN